MRDYIHNGENVGHITEIKVDHLGIHACKQDARHLNGAKPGQWVALFFRANGAELPVGYARLSGTPSGRYVPTDRRCWKSWVKRAMKRGIKIRGEMSVFVSRPVTP